MGLEFVPRCCDLEQGTLLLLAPLYPDLSMGTDLGCEIHRLIVQKSGYPLTATCLLRSLVHASPEKRKKKHMGTSEYAGAGVPPNLLFIKLGGKPGTEPASHSRVGKISTFLIFPQISITCCFAPSKFPHFGPPFE